MLFKEKLEELNVKMATLKRTEVLNLSKELAKMAYLKQSLSGYNAQ